MYAQKHKQQKTKKDGQYSYDSDPRVQIDNPQGVNKINSKENPVVIKPQHYPTTFKEFKEAIKDAKSVEEALWYLRYYQANDIGLLLRLNFLVVLFWLFALLLGYFQTW
ncbi:hypothetical protein [Neomoorella thermoacetica]|uniref:hypothetical protein n=1 Tax=Neomoorella thermoacetica TaxID=1525 RepID=UPI0015D67081|nr:hypothetical protein [Moorella thermoacetica]